MHSFWYKLKRNKPLFAILVCALLVAVLDLSCIIFDVAELIVTSKNSTNLSGAFIIFNIVTVAINVILLICYIIYLIIKKKSNKV